MTTEWPILRCAPSRTDEIKSSLHGSRKPANLCGHAIPQIASSNFDTEFDYSVRCTKYNEMCSFLAINGEIEKVLAHLNHKLKPYL